MAIPSYETRCAGFNTSAAVTKEQLSAYGRCGLRWGSVVDPCISNGSCLQLPRGTTIYSLHMDLDLELVIYRIIFPVLVLLSVVANLFVVLVLSKRHMRSPTNVVILYMALAEMLVGLVPFCFYFHYYNLGHYRRRDEVQHYWCYMHKYLTDTLPPIAHNVANWLTVLLAVQRFISIQYPVRSRKWIRIHNVQRATIVIVLVSALNGLQKTFDYHISVYDGHQLYRNGTAFNPALYNGSAPLEELHWHRYRQCARTLTWLVMAVTQDIYFNLYFWTRCIVFIMIPCVSLIIFNTLLIKGVRKAQIRRDRLLRENRTREAQRAYESNTTSIMLVIIVSIFLFVNFPQAIFIAVFCFNITFDLQMPLLTDTSFPTLFLLASNMLIIFAYPINFAIYCSMSSQFRQTFKQLFCISSIAGRRTNGAASTATTNFARCSTARRSDGTLAASSRLASEEFANTPSLCNLGGMAESSASRLFTPYQQLGGGSSSNGDMQKGTDSEEGGFQMRLVTKEGPGSATKAFIKRELLLQSSDYPSEDGSSVCV